MKDKLSTAGAVLSSLCAFKVCCIVPSLLSLLGLAGSGAALVAARWAAPVLLVVSLLLMGRSFYSIYVLKCGSRASRFMTWASVVTLSVVWTVRLVVPVEGHAASRGAAVAGRKEAPASCPCHRKGGA